MNVLQWEELIRKRNVWIDHNFPGGDAIDSVIGVIEELGELAHGHLKLKQAIRTDEDHDATISDSVADLTIYLLGVMKETGPPGVRANVSHPLSPDSLLLQLSVWVGHLSDIADPDSGVTVNAFSVGKIVSGIVSLLERYCAATQRDFDAIVLETWSTVEQRDWIAYPDSKGMPPEDKS